MFPDPVYNSLHIPLTGHGNSTQTVSSKNPDTEKHLGELGYFVTIPYNHRTGRAIAIKHGKAERTREKDTNNALFML
jgi:hypothetical protein